MARSEHCSPKQILQCLAVALFTASALSGCQVFQPFVMPRHFGAEDAKAKTNGICKPANADDEIAYARAVEQQLSCFARQHAEFASAVGYTLIPLASLVAYQGFAQANPHNIAALSGAGFAAYGIAGYQYKPRDVIYLSGVAAVDCAIQVATPSTLSEKQQQDLEQAYKNFTSTQAGTANELATAAARLSGAQARLVQARIARTRVPAAAAADLRTALDSAIDAVAQRIDADRTTLRTLSDTQAQLPEHYMALRANDLRVRRELASTAESIVNAVNGQIATMTPNPASLATLLAGLKLPQATPAPAAKTPDVGDTSSKQVAGAKFMAMSVKGAPPLALDAATPPPSPDPVDLVVAELANAQADLVVAEQSLRNADTAMGPFRGYLASLATPTPMQALYHACAIDVKAPVALSVALPKGDVEVKNGGPAVNLPVTGGTGKYTAVVMDPADAGTLTLEVKQGAGNSSVLALSAKDFTDTPTLHVIVQDEAGTSLSFPVNIAD